MNVLNGNAGLLPECSVGNHSRDGSSLRMHSSYRPTINGRLFTDHTKLYTVASGKGRTYLNDTHKRNVVHFLLISKVALEKL